MPRKALKSRSPISRLRVTTENVDWIRSDGHSGNWYAGDVVDQPMENWLCPALLYFVDPPKHIFVCCEPLPENIDTILNPSGHE